MKKKVTHAEGRPPRIPTTLSQKSKEADTTMLVTTAASSSSQRDIQRTCSVESRTLEMTAEGMETESQEKVEEEPVAMEEAVALQKSPSQNSKSSAKWIQKAFSKQTPSMEFPVMKNHQPFEEEEVAMEEASNIPVEEDEEAKAKEQEERARKMILDNIAESNRRFQRSVQARKQMLMLVRQKENPQDEILEEMTLPPMLNNKSRDVRSVVTTPAQLNSSNPPPVSLEQNDSEVVKLAEPSTTETKKFDHAAVKTVLSDKTPKIRGGSRLFGFFTASPEKRKQEAKTVKEIPPAVVVPQLTKKIINLHRCAPKRTDQRFKDKHGTEESLASDAGMQSEIERRLVFPSMKSHGRGKRFPFLKKRKSRKVPSPRNSPKRLMSPKKSEPLYTIPKVTYIEQEDASEAIEVEAFERADGVESFIHPPCWGPI